MILISISLTTNGASQVALVIKNPRASVGDVRDAGSIPGLGRSPGGGHLVPSLHGKYMGKQWLTVFFWAPKSVQMVTAAMKLKDAYSLEGKL